MSLLTQNVMGLTPFKCKYFVKKLKNFQLILLNETWWLQKQSPLIHEHTIGVSQETNRPTNHVGHRHGGLIILGSPNAKQNSKIIKCGEHYILFKYHNIVILFIYFPPSLSDTQIQSILGNLYRYHTRPDIVLGDFNIRLGTLNEDTQIHPKQRISTIFQYTELWSLEWIRGQNQNQYKSRVDHIFARKNTLDWTYNKSIVSSDHGYMSILLNQLAQDPTTLSETYRFNIRLLRQQEKIDELCKVYNDCRPYELANSFKKSYTDRATSNDHTQEIIDNAYETLQNRIIDICTIVLGEYNVSEAKISQDRILENINEKTSNIDAILIFKRSQRGNATQMHTADLNKTVYEKAMEHYTSIWNNETLQNDAKLLPEEESAKNLENPFSEDIISTKIRKYSSTKSCGSDSIHITILKALLNSKFVNDIKELFGFFYTLGKTPTIWNTANTVLLPKKPGEVDVTKTRPISLTIVLRRIFESVLHSNWQNKDWSQYHMAQAGSRKGYSCLTHTLINDHLSKTGHKHTVILDIIKAFDSTRHVDILAKLRKRNAPPGEIKLIHSLFMKNMKTHLIVNHLKLEEINLTNGIFQGSVLSPFLFEIFIDDLLQKLNGPNFNKGLGYVDDLILKAKTNVEMSENLRICEAWGEENFCKFNLEKSFLIKSKFSEPQELYGKPLKESKIEKYLGIETSYNGIQWNAFLTTRIEKARKLLSFCLLKGIGWPQSVKLQIYKTFVQPQLDYMGPALHIAKALICSELLVELKQHFKNAIAWIYEYDSSHALKTLQSMAMLRDPEQRWEELHATFVSRKNLLNEVNPFLDIAHKEKYGPWPLQKIIPRILRIPEKLYQYDRYKSKLQFRKKPNTLKTFLNKEFIKWCESDQMPKYISTKSRLPHSYIDKVFYIKDSCLRTKALLWRRNLLYQRKQCYICNAPFRRSHIDKCGMLLEPAVPPDLKRNLEEFLNLPNPHKAKDPKDINTIDKVINHSDWELLKSCFDYLEYQFD